MEPRTIRTALALCLGLYSLSGWALPSAKRLFQSVYGYKVSCQLCHTEGGGSRRNSYGDAFHRVGFDLAAFKKLEDLDSDKDGIKNLEEIVAKSNPGDAKSLSTAPGDWLQKADDVNIPTSQLLKIFPDADQFGVLEGELNADQVASAQKKLGRSLTPEEKVPTYYFSIKQTKKTGVIQVVETSKDHHSMLILGVGISQDGRIHCVMVLKNHAKVAVPDKFLKQLQGLTADTLPTTGLDFAITQDVVNAVRGVLVVMNQVFGS